MKYNVTVARNELHLFDIVHEEIIEDEEELFIALWILENGAEAIVSFRYYGNNYVKTVEYSYKGATCSWQEYGERW